MDKKGRVSYGQTDMLIHVVNNHSNTILDVARYGGAPPPGVHVLHFLLEQEFTCRVLSGSSR